MVSLVSLWVFFSSKSEILFSHCLSSFFSLGLGFSEAGSCFSFVLLNAHNLSVCLKHLYLFVLCCSSFLFFLFHENAQGLHMGHSAKSPFSGPFCPSSWAFSTRLGPMTLLLMITRNFSFGMGAFPSKSNSQRVVVDYHN